MGKGWVKSDFREICPTPLCTKLARIESLHRNVGKQIDYSSSMSSKTGVEYVTTCTRSPAIQEETRLFGEVRSEDRAIMCISFQKDRVPSRHRDQRSRFCVMMIGTGMQQTENSGSMPGQKTPGERLIWIARSFEAGPRTEQHRPGFSVGFWQARWRTMLAQEGRP